MDHHFTYLHGDKNLTLKFSVLQFSLWATWCSFFSFAGMYFVQFGYGYSFIGAALSVAISCSIAGQLFWGFLCDRLRSVKKVYIISNIMLLATILSFIKPYSQLYILVFMGFFGFCQMPLPAMLDSWIFKKNATVRLNYGFIRMWAAIGFSVFGWIVGFNIGKSGYWVMFIYASLFVAITVVTSLLTADAGELANEAARSKGMAYSYIKLLKNNKYVVFLIACFLIGLGNQATDNLRPMVVNDAGGNSNSLGFIIFFSAITELPFFLYSEKIFSWFTSRQCFIFACCAYMLHFLLVAVSRSITALTIGMMFQGIGFSLLLPNLRSFAYHNVPEELSTTGQTLMDALLIGLAGVVASAFGAIILEFTGVTLLYSICIGLAALALGIFLKVTAPVKINTPEKMTAPESTNMPEETITLEK